MRNSVRLFHVAFIAVLLRIGSANCSAVPKFHPSGNTTYPLPAVCDRGEVLAWETYQIWNAITSKKQRLIKGSRNWSLRLTIIGASLQTIANSSPVGTKRQVINILGSVCIGIVPVIASKILNKQNLKDQAMSFILAKETKAEYFKYVARVGPYGNHVMRSDVIMDKLEKMRDEHITPGLMQALVSVQPKTPCPIVPEGQDCREWYKTNRLQKTIDRRRERARMFIGRSNFLKAIELMLTVSGVSIGVINSVGAGSTTGIIAKMQSSFGTWGPCITTASSSLVAHLEACQLETNAIAQQDTIFKLQKKLNENVGESVTEWEDYVNSCEEIFLSHAAAKSHRMDSDPDDD